MENSARGLRGEERKGNNPRDIPQSTIRQIEKACIAQRKVNGVIHVNEQTIRSSLLLGEASEDRVALWKRRKNVRHCPPELGG